MRCYAVYFDRLCDEVENIDWLINNILRSYEQTILADIIMDALWRNQTGNDCDKYEEVTNRNLHW